MITKFRAEEQSVLIWDGLNGPYYERYFYPQVLGPNGYSDRWKYIYFGVDGFPCSGTENAKFETIGECVEFCKKWKEQYDYLIKINGEKEAIKIHEIDI